MISKSSLKSPGENISFDGASLCNLESKVCGLPEQKTVRLPRPHGHFREPGYRKKKNSFARFTIIVPESESHKKKKTQAACHNYRHGHRNRQHRHTNTRLLQRKMLHASQHAPVTKLPRRFCGGVGHGTFRKFGPSFSWALCEA